MGAIVLPIAAQLSWDKVAQALCDVANAVAPTARNHSEWRLQPRLGASVDLITVREEDVLPENNLDVGLIHSWMVGIERANIYKGPHGNVPEIGGFGFEWEITYSVWGFFEDQVMRSDGLTGQQMAQHESELMSATVQNNQTLGLEPPEVEALTKVGLLEFSSLGDPVEFSEGVNVIVPQGSITVRISRDIK